MLIFSEIKNENYFGIDMTIQVLSENRSLTERFSGRGRVKKTPMILLTGACFHRGNLDWYVEQFRNQVSPFFENSPHSLSVVREEIKLRP